MSKNIIFNVIFLLFLVSCGDTSEKTEGCDQASSSAFEESFECPSGTPKNEDIVLVENLQVYDFEAGFKEKRLIEIKNQGNAKLFDFKITSDFVIIFNNCPTKFDAGESCVIEVEIEETAAGEKTKFLQFSERTNQINKKEDLTYTVVPSYPLDKKILFDNQELQFNSQRILVGPLQDRFGNIINERFNITSNRILKENEFNPIAFENLNKESISGSFSFILETDNLQNNTFLDSGIVNITSPRIYKDGTILNETISITFFNNKPTIDPTIQNFEFLEDSEFNPLPNLTQGEDPQGLPITHAITKFPENGVISNCLTDETFINFITCSYTPNPNFYGEDTIEYKAFNGDNDSFDSAVIKINVTNVKDNPILKDFYQLEVLENTPKTVQLPRAVDYDGQTNFLYEITQQPQNGSLNCNLGNCTYIPNNSYIGTDSFKFKAKDIDNLESAISTYQINVVNKNDKPILGGNQTFSTVEDNEVSFTLTAATDPDNNLSHYKIKERPNKGILRNCLDNNLSCTYVPNKDVDTADAFTYVAVDTEGEESDPRNVTITITQVNDAPYFESLYQEQQVVPNSPSSFLLTEALDPDSNSLNYEIVTFPTKGNISNCLGVGGIGLNCQYQPPQDVFDETATFTYRAQDPNGLYSEIKTVNIIISNSNGDPNLTGSIIVNLLEEEEKNFTLIRANDDYTPQGSIKYFIGTNGLENGTLEECLNEADLQEDAINCKYTPNTDFVGIDDFTYYAEDASGNRSAEILVTLNVSNENDPPKFQNENELSFSGNEDEDILINLDAGIDPENDEVSYSIDTNVSQGNLNCDFNSLTCNYKGDLNYNGEDNFIYKVTDGQLESTKVVKIIILAVNDKPILNDQTIQTIILEDKSSNFTIGEANDIDTDNSLLSYELINAPEKGLLSNCLGINGINGLDCVYLGKSNENTTDSFKIRAFDGELYSDTATINISIQNENDLPYFPEDKLGPFRIEAGDSINLSLISALDLEGDFLQYEVVEQPKKGELFNCLQGQSLDCIYVADKNSEGTDSFVYKAYDPSGDSFNNVTVNFIIEKEKSHRIFKLETKSLSDYAQRNLLSTPKKIYNFPSGKMFYLASSEENYNNNSLRFISNNGSVQNYNITGFVSKELFIEDRKELLLFQDAIGTGSNKIVSVKENLEIQEVTFPNNLNPSGHVYFNKNVYAGSNQSKLYKLNLLELNNKLYYYYDHLIKKDRLGLNRDNSEVTIQKVLDDKIIFSYQDDDSDIRFGIINKEQDRLVLVPKNNDIKIKGLRENLYYEKENTIYFLTQLADGSQKIVYLNIENREISAIEVNISLQNNLSKMSLYESEVKDYIVFMNEENSRIAILQLDFNLLIDIQYENIVKYEVSIDKNKLVFLENSGNIYVTKRNPAIEVEVLNGVPSQDILPIVNDQFLVKRRNSREMFFLDSRNIFEKVDVESAFNYSAGDIVYVEDQIYLRSRRNTIFGEIYEYYEYKYNLRYDTDKNISNFIYGLPSSGLGQTINLVETPTNGTLSNCLSLNSTSINDLECSYLPNSNYVGLDEFRYDFLNSSNEIVKQLNIELNVKNQRPYFDNKREVVDFFAVEDLNLEILDYTYIDNELFFSSYSEQENKYYMYRYNKAEGLRLILQNENEITTVEKNNRLLFFVINNELYKYLPEQKTYSIIYEENNNVAFNIVDVYVKDEMLFMITKGSGNPPINSLIEINLNNNNFQRIVLPAELENGSFIPFGETFYIESRNKISLYNMQEQVFINNDTLSDPIQVGRGLSKENFLIFILDSQLSGINVTSLVIYDPVTQTELSKTPLFALGFKTGDIAAPQLNENGTYSFLVETIALDNSGSTNELIRKDIQSRDERVLDFSGIYGFDTLIKEENQDIYFVSRSDDWKDVIFYTYANNETYYVLNGASTQIDLPTAYDDDAEEITYNIISQPSYGRLENCMGLNSSDKTDINCDYIHTDTSLNSVIDNFSYQATDGFETSEVKTININIRNNPPEVEVLTQNVDVNKNIQEDISFVEANDPEGNIIYFIIEDLPSKGTLTNCSLSIQNLIDSSYCTYIPNNDQIGQDSYSYRAYDGLSYSDKVTVNINIIDNNSPIFISNQQKEYVSKSTINYIVILEKALDPQGRELTYSITRPAQFGSLSNCFNLVDNRLQCTYTPDNPSLRVLDSFKYKASNGDFESVEREVLISVTASNMTGSLGSLTISEDNDVYLVKNGVDNTDALRNLEGYNFNNDTKVLTLPANREYNFVHLNIANGYTIRFKPFDNVGNLISEHGFTRVYAQGSCFIDGRIEVYGGLTNGSEETVTDNSIDEESLSYTLDNYILGVFGGKGGGSSETQRTSGLYGNPSLFKSGNGEPGVGDIGDEIQGGDRGRDGMGVYLKCLESLEGIGVIDVSGQDGENGIDGRDGNRNDITEVSFGGSGGSGGGNGGFGGSIYLKSTSILFSGDLNINGGSGGLGGLGGQPDTEYTIPFEATSGTNAQDGINGFSGTCLQSDLNSSFSNCF